jgi:glucose-1-phosphate adenylyltransferase
MEGVLGLVLAGGRGRRMGVLCDERAKPLLPFAGKFSVIDFSLSNCINSQISDVAALTDYKHQQVADYLKKWSVNNALPDLTILSPRNNSYRGTADAVYQNLDFVNQTKADKVLILAGDHVYKMDYRKMLAFHNETEADVTVAVMHVPLHETHRFGTISVDYTGRIHGFAEKSHKPLSSIASMGIYIFNVDVLTRRLEADAAKIDSPHDFGYAILPGMVNSDRVFAYEYDGYWQDIGTEKAYYETNMELLSAEPPIILNDESWPIFSSLQPGNEPEIQGGVVSNSLVGDGCMIKGRVENSVLSPGVYVGEQAVVKNSIILANTTIGYHSFVDRSILDENINIGNLCYIGFQGTPSSGSGDITVLGKDVQVPSYTGIGCNCRIQPRVLAQDFATRLVRSGTVVSSGRK